MTDDQMGECKSCGENAGSKPAAKSAAEVARESWLQDLVVRPYQPTVEVLAATNRGEAAVAAMEPPVAARPASQESPISLEHSRPQPRVEISYLPTPWDRREYEPNVAPIPPILERPIDDQGVDYIAWFPGDGSPWVEAQVAGAEGCTCELICGPVCLSQTVLLSPESAKQSNSKCETQKNASMLVTVKLKGGNGKKGLLRLSSPDRRVKFGGLAVVGYGSHANPSIGGLYPIFDMVCGERTLELPNVSCPATVEFLVCTDDDKDFDVIADWGGGAARCTKKVAVKKCLCACFQSIIDAAWKTLVKCPQFVDFYQGIGIEQGPKIPGPTYEPDLSVKCMEVDEFEAVVGTQPQAYIDLSTMEIVLKCGNATPEASILFELTNAASRHKHTEIDRKARDTKVSKEDFVRQHERIEWEGLKTHHSIAQKCVAAGLWDKALDRWASAIGPGGAFENFEDYLKVQKAASHPKVFEEWWDKNAKK